MQEQISETFQPPVDLSVESLLQNTFPDSRQYIYPVPSTGRVKIVTPNATRTKLILQNQGSDTIYIGTADVDSTNGFQILAGQTYGDDIDAFTGEFWALAASGTQNLMVRDEFLASR